MKIFIITSTPSFYKDNLFHKLSELSDLKVAYTNTERIKRNNNFYSQKFKDIILFNKNNIFYNIYTIYKFRNYDSIILSGWDDIYYWIARLILPKRKLKVIVESSIYEYKPKIILDHFKKFYLNGISKAIVSGIPQSDLLKHFNFKGLIFKSLGVGVLDFNYKRPDRFFKQEINNFLFIGRISSEKGFPFLLKFFKLNPNLTLNVIGAFEDLYFENEINKVKNIIYHGYKNRNELHEIFVKSDVLILPSIIEPWGLVVEEAIYHGLPVIVSDKVGCSIDIVKNNNLGIIFDCSNFPEFEKSVNLMILNENYEFYRDNIYNYDFKKKDFNYINMYLNE